MIVAKFTNTTPTVVAADANVLFTSNSFSTDALQYTSDGIKFRVPGVYYIAANFTVTTDTAGTATVNLQENGVDVAGAIATATVGADDVVNLDFSTVINVKSDCCSNEYATISFINTNEMTYNVANVIIKRLCD